MATIEAVCERLDGLERENRRLRAIAAALLAGVVALGAVAILGPSRGVRNVDARQVTIRDQEGRVRASLGVDPFGQPSLKLFDKRGLAQVDLASPLDDTASLSFSHRGTTRAVIDTSVEGSASIRMYNSSERLLLGFAIDPQGRTNLLSTDARGLPVSRPFSPIPEAKSAGDHSMATASDPSSPRPAPRPAGDDTESHRQARGMAN